MRSPLLLLFVAMTSAMTGAMTGAQAAPSQKAIIARQEDKIPNLEFEETELDVKLDDNGPVERPYVMLNGRFKAGDGSLTISSQGNRPIKLDNGERFKFRVYLKNKQTEFKLAEVDALGNVKYETIHVDFDGWENFRQDLELDFKREFIFIPSVGITSASYSETIPAVGTGPTAIPSEARAFSGLLLTPKFTVNYRYAPRWTIGINTFFSAVKLSGKSTSTVSGVETELPGYAGFLGINGRIGYQLSSIRDPWNLALGTGIYYVSTFGTSEMGFSRVMGPQFTANLRYRFNARDGVTFAFKFAPIGESFYLRKISDNEIALGIGVSRAFREGKSTGSITLDWAKFNILLEDVVIAGLPAPVDVPISNSSISLSASYSF